MLVPQASEPDDIQYSDMDSDAGHQRDNGDRALRG